MDLVSPLHNHTEVRGHTEQSACSGSPICGSRAYTLQVVGHTQPGYEQLTHGCADAVCEQQKSQSNKQVMAIKTMSTAECGTKNEGIRDIQLPHLWESH